MPTRWRCGTRRCTPRRCAGECEHRKSKTGREGPFCLLSGAGSRRTSLIGEAFKTERKLGTPKGIPNTLGCRDTFHWGVGRWRWLFVSRVSFVLIRRICNESLSGRCRSNETMDGAEMLGSPPSRIDFPLCRSSCCQGPWEVKRLSFGISSGPQR